MDPNLGRRHGFVGWFGFCFCRLAGCCKDMMTPTPHHMHGSCSSITVTTIFTAMLYLRALSSVVLGMILWTSTSATINTVRWLDTKENGNLARADAVLETIFGDGADARVLSIQGGDFRHALHACVTAVNLDPSNIVYSEKLLKLLQRVVDSRELLIQFEDAARALLEAGNREAVGLLGINLAESMERTRTDVDPAVQEMLLRHSIHAFPEHPIAVVSLGYRLEQRGEELQAMELYSEGIARDPDRLDLQLLLASSCSPFLSDADQGEMRFSRVSSEMGRLAHDIQMFGTRRFNLSDPGRDIGYMPSFSWQYMGRNMRPLMETLCWILAAMTTTLHEAPPTLHPDVGWDSTLVMDVHQNRQRTEEGGGSEIKRATTKPVTSGRVVDGRINVGVVLERRTNHSPHRLIQGVLEGMDRSKFRLVAFAHDHEIDYPPAGEAVLEAAEEVFVLPWHPFVSGMPDPFTERKIIIMAQVDVLLYMALGNTLGSHLLALGRLAPVQVSFGHGHPVTSGSPGIDYIVSSTLFETNASFEAREARRLAGTASDVAAATTAADDGTSLSIGSCVTTSADVDRPLSRSRPDSCNEVLSHNALPEGKIDYTAWRGRGDGTQDYTEQLVLFDSLTASLPEVSGPSNAPHIVALEARALSSELLREDDHAYHCIQHSKKFHPDFDPVLRGVLLGDAAAKILLTQGSKVHLPRWKRTLGRDLIRRLIFLPPLQYPDMLKIVAHCRVMLDTFPWGAGVTSMEALSAGVPVVTLPARISVLNLAAGQLTELGVGGDLIASDINSMVKTAVKLASDPSYRERTSAKIISRKGRLSNPDRAVEEWERFLERAVRSAVRDVAPQ